MEVFLARIGAGGAHKRAMDKDQWLTLVARVATWSDDAVAAALADLGIGTGVNASSSSSATALTEREEATRKTVRLLVEQSTKAYGAIWSALSDDLRAQASKGGEVPLNFARGLWAWLETKFQSTEMDSIGELLAQWIALQQDEDESFDAYRARVNHLRGLLAHAKEPQSDNMYAYVLLDRLQPRYAQAVLALKAGGQLKDAAKVEWDSVTAFVNAHERNEQRQSGAGGPAMANAARGASVGGVSAVKTPQQEPQRTTGSESSWSQQRRSRPSQDRRSCFRCDQRGHLAATCPNPPKRPAAPGAGPAAEKASAVVQTKPLSRPESRNRFEAFSSDDDADSEEPDSRAGWPALGNATAATTEAAVSASGTQQPKRSAAQPSWADKVMQASSLGSKVTRLSTRDGQTLKQSATSSAQIQQLDKALANHAWGWDTMASSGCSGNRARFSALRKCRAVPVKVADGSIVAATHIGSVPLRVRLDNGGVVRIVVDDVLYHQRFSSNLLSGEQLTSRKHGWQYHSTPECTYVVTPGGDRVTLSRQGRVSVLFCVDSDQERASSAITPPVRGKLGDDEAVEQLLLLHQRLNHMGWTRMLATLRSGAVEDLGVRLDALPKSGLAAAEKHVRQCTACLKGRATRTAFGHRGLDRGRAPGECVHMDSYPVRVWYPDGRTVVEYGLAAKCMYSDYTWHGRFKSKDLIAPAVASLVQLVQTQFGREVKRLYSDGGSEFINQTLKAFCAKHGKVPGFTPARSQELNGAAERTVRTIKDHETMMLLHAGAPRRLWGYAGEHAAFVWNRTHLSKETRVTPYEAMRGKKPSAKHLGVWGCDAFCHVPKEQRDALAPKAQDCIYLGHNTAQNAANVLLLSTQKVICSRDVTFRSGSFSFLRTLERGGEELSEASAAAAGADSVGPGPAPSNLRAHSDAPQVAQASDAEEYVVESIVGRRTKNGRVEYKVHWAGYDACEDSWEPEAEVVDLAAMERWQALQLQETSDVPAPAAAAAAAPAASHAAAAAPGTGPRQSPRQHASSAALRASRQSENAGLDDDAVDSAEPLVHMAMSALRGLQLPEERPGDAIMMSAIAAGIAVLEQQTPRTYREAMASPDAAKWQAGLDKEMRSCIEQKVWSLVRRDHLPKGANVLPCKEVFKVKVDELGNAIEHKARFTPKGFRQKKGVDFFETFARTGQYKTLRAALSLVAKWDHELAQFDVPTAFLNAEVEEDIFMELPDGFQQDGMVCKLHKSLYGLKQAPRNWDLLVHGFIVGQMGFKATVSDPSLYFKRSHSGRVMMIYRFVDDMQGSHHAEDAAEFQENVKLLQDRFRGDVDVGDAHHSGSEGSDHWLGSGAVRDEGVGEVRLAAVPGGQHAGSCWCRSRREPVAGHAGRPSALHGDHRHTHVRGNQHPA